MKNESIRSAIKTASSGVLICLLTACSTTKYSGEIREPASEKSVSISGRTVFDEAPVEIVEKILPNWSFKKMLQKNPSASEPKEYMFEFSQIDKVLGIPKVAGEVRNRARVIKLEQIGKNQLKVTYYVSPTDRWQYGWAIVEDCVATSQSCLNRIAALSNKKIINYKRESDVSLSPMPSGPVKIIGVNEGRRPYALVLGVTDYWNWLESTRPSTGTFTVDQMFKYDREMASENDSNVETESKLQIASAILELTGPSYRLQIFRSGNLLTGRLLTNTIAARLGEFTGSQDFPNMLKSAAVSKCESKCNITRQSSASGIYTIQIED